MSTELVERLRDAEQRIAALMSERSSLIATKAEQLAALTMRATAAEAANTALTAKVALLTEALRPFVREADARANLALGPDIDHWPIGGSALTLGDLRAARRALSEPDKEVMR